LIKRQKAYTNQQTAGGKVKVKNKWTFIKF
jgi:hypothetical protein